MVFALIAIGVAFSVATGFLLYALAPLAGYTTEQDRKGWRSFGFNWGWLVPRERSGRIGSTTRVSASSTAVARSTSFCAGENTSFRGSTNTNSRVPVFSLRC
jgi:hypothetical protein